MPERCEVTELLRGECAHCRPPEPKPAPVPASPTIEARYEGRCAGCGDEFPAGTPITADPEGHGWLADCCTEGAESA
jgi:hypothetical protein